MRRLLSFVAGILAGGSIGAGIALFFAPKSGDEMRQSMRDRVIELKATSATAAADKEAELRQELADLTKGATVKIDSPAKTHPNGNSPAPLE